MSLSHTTTFAALSVAVSGQSRTTVISNFNSDNTTTISDLNSVQADLENTVDDAHGRGVVSGSISAGTGLQVDNSAMIVVVGRRLSLSSGSTNVTASKTNSPIYVGNDGLFYVDSPPAAQDYVKVAEYTSSGAAVTSVANLPDHEKKLWGANLIVCHDNQVVCHDNQVVTNEE